MRGVICKSRTVIETLTTPLFWKSLVKPPLVVVSGHIWPHPPKWGMPTLSEYGMIQYDESKCVDCGYQETPRPWRQYYGNS